MVFRRPNVVTYDLVLRYYIVVDRHFDDLIYDVDFLNTFNSSCSSNSSTASNVTAMEIERV